MEDDELDDAYERSMNLDHKNINDALDDVIDSLSKFKAADRVDDLTSMDFADIMEHLHYAQWVIGGVMYQHGIPLCGHLDHDDDDDDDEDEDDD